MVLPLTLRHRSRIGKIEVALRQLGKRLDENGALPMPPPAEAI